MLRTYTAASQLLFMVEGEVPALRADLRFALPLTGKPDAADTKRRSAVKRNIIIKKLLAFMQRLTYNSRVSAKAGD